MNAADVCRNCAVLAKKRIRNLLLEMWADRLVRLDGAMESAVESETGSNRPEAVDRSGSSEWPLRGLSGRTN